MMLRPRFVIPTDSISYNKLKKNLALKPKMVKPVPKPPPSSSQQQEVSKKQAKKAAKVDKKTAAKAAKQQAAEEEDEDMEVLEDQLWFLFQSPVFGLSCM